MSRTSSKGSRDRSRASMGTLTFLGAAGTVTGSKTLVEAGGLKILVDTGLFQGEKEWRTRRHGQRRSGSDGISRAQTQANLFPWQPMAHKVCVVVATAPQHLQRAGGPAGGRGRTAPSAGVPPGPTLAGMAMDGTRNFAVGGDAYDAFMGRYAVLLAPLMADVAGVAAGQRALDVGCGTGALTGELVRRLGAVHVAGCDPSSSQLETCRARHPDVDLRDAPAEQLPWSDGVFDVALAQLVMHFTTDADRAADEMRRVVAPGGRVAVCVWDFEGGMQMLRAFWDAAVTVDPRAPDELLTMRFGRAGELSALLTGVGLTDVREEELAVARRYDDFAELWSTLLLGVGPAGAHLVALPEDQQERLRTAYLERLGLPEGPFTLGSVARAAVGTVPAAR